MVLSMFGLIMMPTQKDRRIIANGIETIHENLQFYKDAREPIKRPLLGTFF